MPRVNKDTQSRSKRGRQLLIAVSILAYVLLLALLMRGKNVALMNPKGFIALQQHNLMLYVIAIMLILAIPVVASIYFTAWKYRESNKKAHYQPNLHHGKFFAVGLWLLPASFIILIAMMMVPATHKLEPRKALADGRPPLKIQVVALRWKWLFIYPDQKIATVNYVQLPLNTPVEFDLTADDAPMSSFWMPNFGGQLYAMTGHVNRLNLQADTAGDYPGKSAEINGAGFAGMQFVAHATSKEAFDTWVKALQKSPNHLDDSTYQSLLKPSENNRPEVYSLPNQYLYDTIVAKYNGGHSH